MNFIYERRYTWICNCAFRHVWILEKHLNRRVLFKKSKPFYFEFDLLQISARFIVAPSGSHMEWCFNLEASHDSMKMANKSDRKCWISNNKYRGVLCNNLGLILCKYNVVTRKLYNTKRETVYKWTRDFTVHTNCISIHHSELLFRLSLLEGVKFLILLTEKLSLCAKRTREIISTRTFKYKATFYQSFVLHSIDWNWVTCSDNRCNNLNVLSVSTSNFEKSVPPVLKPFPDSRCAANHRFTWTHDVSFHYS
jgi:hypothetical protein